MEQRQPNPATDFTADVEGVGTFTFGKRSLRDVFSISAEYRRLTEMTTAETPEDDFLDAFAQAVSQLKCLIVSGPKGWSPSEIDDMNPFDDATYDNIKLVWGALRKKEATFQGAKAARP